MTQAQFDALRGLQQQLAAIEQMIIYWIEECRHPPAPTIESVYGKPLSELKPPAGYRFTGEFREPRKASGTMVYEPFLSVAYQGQVGTCYEPENGSRLILVKCKRLVFDVVDENRAAKQGEYFCIGNPEYVAKLGPLEIADKCRYILSEPRVEE